MILRNLLAAALLSLLPAAALRGQQLFVSADFETLFDNREYSGTHFPDCSRTLFSARLTPAAGIGWEGGNTLVAAVDLMQDLGDGARFLTEAKPLIYYRFTHTRGNAAAGIFPRSLLRGDYHEAFFDRSVLFYENRMQGFMGSYTPPRGFVELALDWQGRQSPERRERFRILSAGRYDLTPPQRRVRFSVGYALSLQHFAKTSQPVEGEGVVDDILVEPYLGVAFRAFFDFDIRVGLLQALQRDRIAEEGWRAPRGLRLALRLERSGWLLANTLYAGENLRPLAGRYAALYAGSPLFAVPDRILERFEAGYSRTLFSGTLSVGARMLFDYDGRSVGTAQIVDVRVRLQKIFARKNK